MAGNDKPRANYSVFKTVISGYILSPGLSYHSNIALMCAVTSAQHQMDTNTMVYHVARGSAWFVITLATSHHQQTTSGPTINLHARYVHN